MKDVTNFVIKVTKTGVVAPIYPYDEAYEDLRHSIIKLYLDWMQKYTTEEEREQAIKQYDDFLAEEAKTLDMYKDLYKDLASRLK